MRMWMVDPRLLCKNHLLGEHCEVHMLAGALRLGKSIEGYLRKHELEPALLYRRHAELVEEMLHRKMNHRSDPAEVDVSSWPTGFVDPRVSRKELARRCPECRARQRKEGVQ